MKYIKKTFDNRIICLKIFLLKHIYTLTKHAHSYAVCFHPVFIRCNDKPPLFHTQYITATPAAIAPAIPAFLIPAKIQYYHYHYNKYVYA